MNWVRHGESGRAQDRYRSCHGTSIHEEKADTEQHHSQFVTGLRGGAECYEPHMAWGLWEGFTDIATSELGVEGRVRIHRVKATKKWFQATREFPMHIFIDRHLFRTVPDCYMKVNARLWNERQDSEALSESTLSWAPSSRWTLQETKPQENHRCNHGKHSS